MSRFRCILPALCMISLIAACSAGKSARIDLPQNHFETPEANGAGEFRYGVAMRVNDPLVVEFSNSALTPADFEAHRLDDAPVFSEQSDTAGWDALATSLFGSYGIVDAFDIGLEADSFHMAWLKLKWQLLGEPRARAHAGNVSVAVAARATALAVTDDHGCSPVLGCGSDMDYHLAVDNVITDVSLLAGYRMSKDATLYGGGFYQRTAHDAANTVREMSGTTVTSSQRFEWSGETVARGQILGFSVSPNEGTEIALEGVWSEAESEAKRLGARYYGFRFSYAW